MYTLSPSLYCIYTLSQYALGKDPCNVNNFWKAYTRAPAIYREPILYTIMMYYRDVHYRDCFLSLLYRSTYTSRYAHSKIYIYTRVLGIGLYEEPCLEHNICWDSINLYQHHECPVLYTCTHILKSVHINTNYTMYSYKRKLCKNFQDS